VLFSSPLGDGLVHDSYVSGVKDGVFSSPLGDGLVHAKYCSQNSSPIIFVPEWGWVGSCCAVHLRFTNRFSSPLGDGLVLLEKKGYIKVAKYFRPRLGMGWFPEDIKSKMQYFRPRLGMGWFISISLYVIWFRDFRPRLGMGWFRAHGACTTDCQMFSSPVGDWWFNVEQIKDTCLTKFSSPPGDGLVPLKKSTKGKIEHIFVPEWGWVGSRWKNIYLIL